MTARTSTPLPSDTKLTFKTLEQSPLWYTRIMEPDHDEISATFNSPTPADEPQEGPRPNRAAFKPFFTIINDDTGETHHPHVHYIFEDDDTEILTNNVLSSLENHDDSSVPTQIRTILVDLAHDRSIASAKTLSSNFDVSKTTILPAPTFGENTADGAMMLCIQGKERDRGAVASEVAQSMHENAYGRSWEEALKQANGDMQLALKKLASQYEGLIRTMQEHSAR